MKKFFRVLLLTGIMAALLCVCALAADAPTSDGIYGMAPAAAFQDTVTVTASGDASTVTIDSTDYTDFHAGAAQVTVSYSGCTTGSYYLLFTLKDETGIPTASNLAYIDQYTADETGKVTFTVYPGSLAAGTYYIYLSSNSDTTLGSSAVQVASFKYYSAYKLGDVDNDGYFTATDALYVLQMAVGQGTWTETQKLAADVDKDSYITATDALWILQAAVGNKPF